jgi:cell division septation protein DedD
VSDAGRVTVQLAAFRTRANAERGWQRLRAAHPDQLGGRALIMREIDLGDRGIYYRVRTGPFADVAAAKAFCSLLRTRAQDCLVIRLQ